LKSSSSSSNSN